MKIASITPIRYFYNKNGDLFRDLDRLKSQIVSLKNQKGRNKDFSLDIYIGDATHDKKIKKRIKKICSDYGAIYKNISRSDFFNRGLLINDTVKQVAKCDELLLLDLDLVLDPTLVQKFIYNRKLKTHIRVLLAGINFISLSKLESPELPITKELFKYQIKSQGARFNSANGLQFINYKDFLNFGGLDINFNAYCGTDDEILFRMNNYRSKGYCPKNFLPTKREEFCINSFAQPLAYHLNHDMGTSSMSSSKYEKMDNYVRKLLCTVNRSYLKNYIGKTKYVRQDNLNKNLNYLCKKNNVFYWGNEKNVVLKENQINTKSLIQEYLKNRDK